MKRKIETILIILLIISVNIAAYGTFLFDGILLLKRLLLIIFLMVFDLYVIVLAMLKISELKKKYTKLS